MVTLDRFVFALALQIDKLTPALTATATATAMAMAMAMAISPLATAADYPVRPIRFIVPSAPGGSPDINARLLAAELSKQLGQQIVVDNRPGASGVIGMELIIRAAPDGYTLGYGTSAALASNLSVLPKRPYDPLRDLQMVAQLGNQPNLLGASLAFPIKSAAELIDYAKANPGKTFFGSSGNGTSMHLTGELLKIMTSTQLVHVPYKAAQQVISDIIGGQVHFVFDNMGSIVSHVRSGRVRGLAVTSAKRWFSVPELPALAETLPGFEVMVWGSVVFPAGVPKPIVTRLNTEINRALQGPVLKEKFTSIGYEIAGGTPEQLTQFVRREIAKFADIAKRSGAKND
jgi:tripartite-type tricarboxylate transporter receptor subunit TctC